MDKAWCSSHSYAVQKWTPSINAVRIMKMYPQVLWQTTPGTYLHPVDSSVQRIRLNIFICSCIHQTRIFFNQHFLQSCFIYYYRYIKLVAMVQMQATHLLQLIVLQLVLFGVAKAKAAWVLWATESLSLRVLGCGGGSNPPVLCLIEIVVVFQSKAHITVLRKPVVIT